jgi:hypothetical protein
MTAGLSNCHVGWIVQCGQSTRRVFPSTGHVLADPALLHQPIAHAAYCDQPFMADLLTQVANVDVDNVGTWIEIETP